MQLSSRPSDVEWGQTNSIEHGWIGFCLILVILMMGMRNNWMGHRIFQSLSVFVIKGKLFLFIVCTVVARQEARGKHY